MTSVGPGPGVAAGDIGDAKISEPANKRESPASFCNRDSRHHGMATPAPRTSTTAKANYPSHNPLLARRSSTSRDFCSVPPPTKCLAHGAVGFTILHHPHHVGQRPQRQARLEESCHSTHSCYPG